MCSADSSTQSFDIPPDSSELFTVPGLSEREGEKEGGEVRRGRGKPRKKVGSETVVFFFFWGVVVYLSICELRLRACLYVLAQHGFCLSCHHHLVMCDEGQACLWGKALPEVPHRPPG